MEIFNEQKDNSFAKGIQGMTIDMNNQRIINLRLPTNDTDAATKNYLDDRSGTPDLSDYLEKDGTVPMTGNLNFNNKRIVNFKQAKPRLHHYFKKIYNY